MVSAPDRTLVRCQGRLPSSRHRLPPPELSPYWIGGSKVHRSPHRSPAFVLPDGLRNLFLISIPPQPPHVGRTRALQNPLCPDAIPLTFYDPDVKFSGMGSKIEHKDGPDTPDLRELQLLSEVERLTKVNQRHLAKRLGIALGMTNILLHNLVQKGYVRITEAGWRRWVYNLTPDGFARKFNLTLAYINRFFDQYGKIRETLRNELALHPLNAESRVAMYGNGEFAELVYLGLRELGIEEIDVFNRLNGNDAKFLGNAVLNLESLDPASYDRVVIATMASADSLRTTVRDLNVPIEKVISFHVDLSSIFTGLDIEELESEDVPKEA